MRFFSSVMLFLLACSSPPMDLDAAPDDGAMFGTLAMRVRGQAALDGEAQRYEWAQVGDAEFVSFCVEGVAPPPPLSLGVARDPLIILAVQNDGCIEPWDSAFDDIVLFNDEQYILTALTPDDVEFVLTFVLPESD